MARLIFLSAFLFLVATISGRSFNLSADSVVKENKTRKICGHTFIFRKTSYYKGEESILRIFEVKEKDTALVLEKNSLYDWGDCNGRMQGACQYELKGDSLFFYVFEKWVDTMSFDNISSSSSTHKETYVIRKTGKLVRVRFESGKKNKTLDEEIRSRLSEEIDKLPY